MKVKGKVRIRETVGVPALCADCPDEPGEIARSAVRCCREATDRACRRGECPPLADGSRGPAVAEPTSAGGG